MQNIIFDIIAEDLRNIICKIDSSIESKSIPFFTVETPREKSHGDLSTNIAMMMCKKMQLTPRELALQIQEYLNNKDYIKRTDIAGAGFINMKLKNSVWQNVLKDVQRDGNNFGFTNIGKGEKTNVEYVSVNPTGPLHVGHSRGGIYGDVLANLLSKCGYDVTKEYYINDAGNQIKVLCISVYTRYLQALGENVEIPAGCYPGEYLIPIGEFLKDKYNDKLKSLSENEYIEEIREFVVQSMMDCIKDDMNAMGIHHDILFSEKENLHDTGATEETLEFLWKNDFLYKGVLPEPKGVKKEHYSQEELTLFKTKQFGDDEDRAVLKSDGTATYLGGDIPYMKNKIDRGFKKLFIILGVDHLGYVKRIQAVAKAISGGEADLNVFLNGLINFTDNGQVIKMSKRAGTFLTARDVIDDVGKDVLRFVIMTRDLHSSMEFDLSKVKEQTKDNPVFYVQYAHTRCKSVIRNANEKNINDFHNANISLLNEEFEINLMKSMLNYYKVIDTSVRLYEPHRITFYLQDLASSLHSMWNVAGYKFISDDLELTKARLYMLDCASIVIRSGLSVLGVKALNEMR